MKNINKIINVLAIQITIAILTFLFYYEKFCNRTKQNVFMQAYTEKIAKETFLYQVTQKIVINWIITSAIITIAIFLYDYKKQKRRCPG